MQLVQHGFQKTEPGLDQAETQGIRLIDGLDVRLDLLEHREDALAGSLYIGDFPQDLSLTTLG